MQIVHRRRARREAVGRSPSPANGMSLRVPVTAGAGVAAVLLACTCMSPTVVTAGAAVATPRPATTDRAATSEKGGSSLEAAAARAGDTGRAVAMSLIGLAFAVAATVLAFRRDFKEAAGVFAV